MVEEGRVIYQDGNHFNFLLEDFGHGEMVQANVHMIVDDGKGIILDPGGHKVFKHLLTEVGSLIGLNNLEYIFLSHQDPDIVAAINGWLMTTKAIAITPKLWLRFIPHFGVDRFVIDRIKGLSDRGGTIKLGNSKLYIIPAHFLHSPGNFQIYDPVSKTLYSGDLGASLGQDYMFVKDFSNHIKYMEPFHRRYIPCNKALKMWINMVRDLDIETIAPQHGAIMKGKEIVKQFLDWLEDLECGLDIMEPLYKITDKELEF
ncbi:MAG: MBL fold metallo-hydrolase [Persephonella sp.]|nr:MAG: MBL fold metallo-hydrolase [Persephonella sp.]